MKTYQYDFIQFALNNGVLSFGEFKLKSGRKSPYFFNAGMFSNGNAFHRLGSFYSDVIYEHFRNKIDILYGPAYKGISLATAASIGLTLKFNLNIGVTFNRKEMKDHGEGGQVIGASLAESRILLIDDVITAGTTIRESFETINTAKGTLKGIVIALDRQERGINSKYSAIQEVERKYDVEVRSIITLDNIIEYLEQNKDLTNANECLQNLEDYRRQYGC